MPLINKIVNKKTFRDKCINTLNNFIHQKKVNKSAPEAIVKDHFEINHNSHPELI